MPRSVRGLEMCDQFMYQKGKEASIVEYKGESIDRYRILTYRYLNESVAE